MTQGEEYFESYLALHGYSWELEPVAGNNRPDFLVDAETGMVVCEIKDFGENDDDKAVLKAGILSIIDRVSEPNHLAELRQELARLEAIEPKRAGRFDPYPRLQDKARRSAKQMRQKKGQLPCVLVLFNPGSAPNDHDLFLRLAVANNRMFNSKFNTTLSAVAVIEPVFPNKHILEVARSKRMVELESQYPQVHECNKESLVNVLKALEEFESEFFSNFPLGFFEVTEPRLRIYRNPHAALALPPGTFSGKHNVEIDPSEIWKDPIVD